MDLVLIDRTRVGVSVAIIIPAVCHADIELDIGLPVVAVTSHKGSDNLEVFPFTIGANGCA